MTEVVKSINSFLWGPPMMILLVGFGVVSTIVLGFPQFRKLGYGFKETFGKIFFKKDKAKSGSMFYPYYHRAWLRRKYGSV